MVNTKRMKAIIEVCDALLADMPARGFPQSYIERIAKVRADAFSLLTEPYNVSKGIVLGDGGARLIY